MEVNIQQSNSRITNFTEAYNLLEEGRNLIRESWETNTSWLYLDADTVMLRVNKCISVPWSSKPDDITATDWMIAPA